MNHLKQESNGEMAAAEPLFASVWLALFYEIRKNYIERRLAQAESSADSQAQEQK
jgi:hypothetical protein